MKQRKKISVVITVKNDESGVWLLKKALKQQTRKPDEVVIIRAEDYQNCSRAHGRNIGIKKAKHLIIAVTDVGCRPHRNWLEKLISPIERGRADVTAGFYHVMSATPFQLAITPYLAVLPHQLHNHYLPASRSIAFTNAAWKLVGGYPEEATSAGEDLAFARRLSKNPEIRMVHVPDALVDWDPPRSLKAYFNSICDHTRGNFEAHIWPHIIRNVTVPLRWVLFLYAPILIPFYLIWPIVKHKKGLTLQGQTLRSWQFFIWLPVIQLVTDVAILLSIMGVWASNMKR